MPFYVYRIYVMRVPKRSGPPALGIFEFENHYSLAGSYMQKLNPHVMLIPTIDGSFSIPT